MKDINNDVERYRERRRIRLDAKRREEEQEAPKKNHGNTKLPFGLCQKNGIELPPNATPHDAWKALEGKGYGVPWKNTPEGSKTAGEIKGGKSSTGSESSAPKVSEKKHKTYTESVELLKKHNITISDSVVENADEELVSEAAEAIDIMAKDFGDIFGCEKTGAQPYSVDYNPKKITGNGIMGTSMNMMILGAKSQTMEKVKFIIEHATPKSAADWNKDVPEGKKVKETAGEQTWFPKNESLKGMVWHEMGHVMDSYLTRYEAYANNGNQMGYWAISEYNKKWMGKGKSAGADIVRAAVKEVKKKGQTVNEVLYSISVQALHRDMKEAYAEAMGDYMVNGENASEVSKVIYRMTVERYEKAREALKNE